MGQCVLGDVASVIFASALQMGYAIIDFCHADRALPISSGMGCI